jgi:hypothetical protein
MPKHLLLLCVAFCITYSMDAQLKKDSVTNSLQQYLKPVKWKSIGPFRGGRSNTATGGW